MHTHAMDRAQVERMIFFSDAVFAIAITLLVIELKLPELHENSTQGFINALGRMIPNLLGYILSFFVIGAFWAAHHRAFRWVIKTDDKLVWANLRFLLLIAFLPFPTAVLAEHANLQISMIFYAIVLAGATINQIRLWNYALFNPELVSPDAPPAEIKRYFRRAWALLITIGIAALASFMLPHLGALLFGLLPLSIRIASLTPVQRWLDRVEDRFRKTPLPAETALTETTP
jgi:uncharacterized membrane protein